jgi:hypothetical protein
MILLVRVAYLRVETVSSVYTVLGVIQAIIKVLQAPPRESINSLVKVLSLYGMKALSFLDARL